MTTSRIDAQTDSLRKQVEAVQLKYIDSVSEIFRSMENLRIANCNNKYDLMEETLLRIARAANEAYRQIPVLRLHA